MLQSTFKLHLFSISHLFYFTQKPNTNNTSNTGENFCHAKKMNIMSWVLRTFHFHYQTVQAQTPWTVLYLKFPQKGCWRFKCSGMWQCVPWPVVPEIPRDLQPLMMALQSSEISRTTHQQTPCHIPETEHSTHHIKCLSWTQHNLILGVRSTIDSSHHQKQYCNQNIRGSIILKCTSQKWCEVVHQWKALVNTVMHSHVHKMGGMSWLAEKLLAFQEWLTCKEWAT